MIILLEFIEARASSPIQGLQRRKLVSSSFGVGGNHAYYNFLLGGKISHVKNGPKQIVGPIEVKTLGISFHPNQNKKVEFGFVEGFVFDFSGRETENLFPVNTGP